MAPAYWTCHTARIPGTIITYN